ncbi:MAG: hypothetical protein HFI52_00120 [Lachnospiraceae bacterium]|nr:hypothetical protein [Lachnospiraceae bacterium]
MDYNICIEPQEKKIGVNLEISSEADDKFYYYLCTNGGDTVLRSGWINENRYSFEMEKIETGSFYVKAFVMRDGQKYVQKSSGFDFISPKDVKAFHKFCEQKKSYKDFNTEPYYLYHLRPPYSNFCLIHGDFQEEKAVGFGTEYGFDTILVSRESEHKIALIKEKTIDFRTDGVIFSGIGKVKEKLIIGNSNISDSRASKDLSDEIGSFTYCIENNGGIAVGTDYFGIGKIYYHQDENSFVCANSYHTLLLLLKKLGKNLQVNEEVANALLCKMNQPFSQRFCRECEVKGIYILPVGKKIEIGPKVEFTDTSIVQIWNMDREITEEEYIELLKAGKEEILENTRAALSCEYYDRILLELTGGLDSRITYAAASNLDTKGKNLYVITSKGANNQIDVEVAAQVNSVYRLPWEDKPQIFEKYDSEELQREVGSHFLLGGYYAPLKYNAYEKSEKDENIISLNSFFGEICCRPYFSRNALIKYADIEKYDIDRAMEVIVNQKNILSMKSYRTLVECMKKELENLPGESYIEKYESQYLFYRNSFHYFITRQYINRGTWSVLQSKNLYRLCRKMYYRKKDIKVQLDIINEMNPILGCIPYADEKDNLSKKQLLNELYYSDERFRNAVLDVRNEEAMAEWEKAYMQMQESMEGFMKDTANLTEGGANWKEEKQDKSDNKMFELLLHGLMQYENGLFRKQFGIDVFCLKDRTELFYKMLYNKLLSLHLQLRIINDEYNELFKMKKRK